MEKNFLIILALVIVFYSCSDSKKNNNPPDLTMSYRMCIDYILNIHNEDLTSDQIDALKGFKKILKEFSPVKLDSLKNYAKLFINYEISLIQDENQTLDSYLLSKTYSFHKSDKTKVLEKNLLKIIHLPEIDDASNMFESDEGNDLKRNKSDELLHIIKIKKEISELYINNVLKNNYHELFEENI